MSCLFCKHYRLGATCTAFPGGIPMDVISGKLFHNKKLPGQQGRVVYELGHNEANKGLGLELPKSKKGYG